MGSGFSKAAERLLERWPRLPRYPRRSPSLLSPFALPSLRSPDASPSRRNARILSSPSAPASPLRRAPPLPPRRLSGLSKPQMQRGLRSSSRYCRFLPSGVVEAHLVVLCVLIIPFFLKVEDKSAVALDVDADADKVVDSRPFFPYN